MPVKQSKYVTHQELRIALARMSKQIGGWIMNVQEYAVAVDQETNRIADILAAFQTKVANSDASNAAQLAAALDPVLDHMKSVGVEGPTAPPTDVPADPASS